MSSDVRAEAFLGTWHNLTDGVEKLTMRIFSSLFPLGSHVHAMYGLSKLITLAFVNLSCRENTVLKVCYLRMSSIKFRTFLEYRIPLLHYECLISSRVINYSLALSELSNDLNVI